MALSAPSMLSQPSTLSPHGILPLQHRSCTAFVTPCHHDSAIPDFTTLCLCLYQWIPLLNPATLAAALASRNYRMATTTCGHSNARCYWLRKRFGTSSAASPCLHQSHHHLQPMIKGS